MSEIKAETLQDLFVMSEQEVARDKLRLMGGKTHKKELNFMFSQGAYEACKIVARILKINYKFLY